MELCTRGEMFDYGGPACASLSCCPGKRLCWPPCLMNYPSCSIANESRLMEKNAARGPSFRMIDSPWLWGLMFSLMALVGLGLIRPKFDVRQSQIEGRFIGRRQSSIERWRRQSGLEEIDLADSAVDLSRVKPKRIVPLWTLASAATCSVCGCGYMLYREWRKKKDFG